MKTNKTKKQARHIRIRSKISGTEKRPRLCVFRSNKYIYAQLIDDEKGITLVNASDLEVKNKKVSLTKITDGKITKKVSVSYQIGQLIAQRALAKGIETVSFDRGGYKYHGRIKAVADGAREGGLKF